MESDPCCMSLMNVLVNYAGYIGTRKYSDVELACYEFFRIGDWAVRNVMIINITKTKELVFMQKSQGGPCLFH